MNNSATGNWGTTGVPSHVANHALLIFCQFTSCYSHGVVFIYFALFTYSCQLMLKHKYTTDTNLFFMCGFLAH